MGSRVLGLVVLSACGRLGFDGVSDDAAGPPSDTAANVCTSPRLVAHWPLDEVSGATIADKAGAHPGTWNDDTDNDVAGEALAGQRGGALRFGSGSHVFVPGFVVPAEGTFAVWLTSDFQDDVRFGGAHPILLDAPTPRSTIKYDSTQGVYSLRTNGVNQASFMPPADFTGFFHLAATWSASGAQLYLDGIAIGVTGTGDARATSDAELFLGTRDGVDRTWDGIIDDVRIYDYAMSAAEIAALHDCP
jgi:hypothetical protein